MSVASVIYDETFARVRGALCDEVPNYGVTRSGHARKRVAIVNLDDYAHEITSRVLKARGFKENPSRTAPQQEKSARPKSKGV